MDVARFKKLPLMGILRALRSDHAEELGEAVISSGLETIEIAMNSEDAAGLIRQVKRLAKGRLMVGAGTVLNLEILKNALDAGATFIVTPVIVPEVMEYCVKNVIPVFPGALTPGEVYAAWSAGATMVKVFPSGTFGPAYFRELKAPFSHIELMACGGVTAENVNLYFSNGASAVAFGSSVFKKESIDRKDFDGIGNSIKRLVTETMTANSVRKNSA